MRRNQDNCQGKRKRNLPMLHNFVTTKLNLSRRESKFKCFNTFFSNVIEIPCELNNGPTSASNLPPPPKKGTLQKLMPKRRI